jgi:hypothetical protein
MRVRSSLPLAGLFLVAAVLLAAAMLPERYAATARVLAPPPPFDPAAFAAKAAGFDMTVGAHSGSRILSVQHAGADPRRAASAVNAFLRARAADGMLVIDEAPVPFAPQGPGLRMRAALGAAGLLLLVLPIFILTSRSESTAPERSLVRYAIRLAQLGQKTLLVDTGGRFRVVLSGEAAAALGPELKILAQLAGGTLVVARQLPSPALLRYSARGKCGRSSDALSPAHDARITRLS